MSRSSDIFRKATLGCGLALAMSGAADAGQVNVLYAFQGGTDGAGPSPGVISDSQGNLYGTTAQGGGTGCNDGQGCGTVFRVTPDGTETVLYAFQGGPGGQFPYTGLARDKDGNIYGVTGGGTDDSGTGNNCNCGAVFKLAPDGTETVLHTFSGGSDGAYPAAGLLVDKRGNLFGTTSGGGNRNCANEPHGCGTVFKIAPDGTESVIYAFCAQANCADGAGPASALTADKAGNLYGTTSYGGSIIEGGTVFRLAPNGTETVLYSFCQVQPNCQDGQSPMAGVTLDQAGNLYGTTYQGGSFFGFGAVFKLAPDGTETVLHSFSKIDGLSPTSGVIVDQAGDLYGTTANALKCKYEGTVYRLSPDGSEKLSCLPGQTYGGVVEKNGTLYGTGFSPGEDSDGFVFAIKKH